MSLALCDSTVISMTSSATASILLQNAAIVDGTSDRPVEGMSVLIEGERIVEVSSKKINSANATMIDLKGATLMPGLIDCHVHVLASDVSFAKMAMLPDALVAARAMPILKGMLMRGFTTVRDLAGAEIGMQMAVDEGLFPSPRLVICGKALSPTGGHSDWRGRFDSRDMRLVGRNLGNMGRLVDGVPEVRKAAREELKAGAQFIKIMANGGVSSPTDPISYLQFSQEELLAVVEEAAMFHTYVAAHLYTDEAIRRAVECGVVSVEHGNLVTPATAKLIKKKGAFVVPTLVTFEYLALEGAELGLPPESVAKISTVRDGGLQSLEIYQKAGVKMGYGSDLLGAMHRHQSEEFAIRTRVLPTQEVIHSATGIAAEICQMQGHIGVIATGALADLIVVDGNPLKDISLLTGQGRHMPMIMKGGEFMKNELAS